MYFEESGVFIGEISLVVFKDFGVDYCVIGYFECCEMFVEIDEIVNKKVYVVFKYGIVLIICVGEMFEECEVGKINDFVVD